MRYASGSLATWILEPAYLARASRDSWKASASRVSLPCRLRMKVSRISDLGRDISASGTQTTAQWNRTTWWRSRVSSYFYRPVESNDMVEKYEDTLTITKGKHTIAVGADIQ